MGEEEEEGGEFGKQSLSLPPSTNAPNISFRKKFQSREADFAVDNPGGNLPQVRN